MLLRMSFLLFAAMVVSCGASREVVAAPSLTVISLRQNGPAKFHDWRHSPLRALDRQPVRFSASVSSELGIVYAELYLYEFELYRNDAGLHSQRRRPGGLWGRVAQIERAAKPKRSEFDYTHEPGFGAATRLEYVWRVVDVDGAVTDRLGVTDAGTSPWPKDKVLLYAASRRPMTDLIDIGFFRDVDYGNDITRYHADVEAMVMDGFLSPAAYGGQREHWAFYTTDRSADGAALSADVTNENLIPGFLKDFSIPGIDAFCLVHRQDYTDRSLMLENFHSLSNNLFSAEAQNWGTAVHESGHVIFHLSDEYEGCACFQSHAGSNVFRERADCAQWNRANGFAATDCYELADAYQRSWWSAEEPTFFANANACREHNSRLGISPDSCRIFVDEIGRKRFWSFESTCIMHDDGDDQVRPFQRACRKVIDERYAQMRRRQGTESLAAVGRENIYGYEPVLLMAMHRVGTEWSVELAEARLGIPSASSQAAGEVTMRVLDADGQTLVGYRLANAGAVHAHGPEDAFAVPEEGTVWLSVPASPRIERISCEYDRAAHERTPDLTPGRYVDGFTFEIGMEARALMARGKK